jgi:hypothetical protein
MKRFLPALAIPLAAATLSAYADDAEVVLSRSKKLEDMEFRSKQLTYQASMADSYKKMQDAGFLISDDGKLVGVPDMDVLGKELRTRATTSSTTASSDLPFNMNPPGMPSGAPFTLEQPSMGPGLAVQGAPMQQPPLLPPGTTIPQGTTYPQGATMQAAKKLAEAPKEEVKKTMRLTEIRSNSVLLLTDNGISEVKIGQKFDGYTLKSIDANSANFTSPKGPKTLKFSWNNSSRYGGE